jgi:ankyrin repeat protein
VNRLVELGASINEKTERGRTPLHLASEKGYLNVIDRLIQLGASVNERDEDELSPLLVALEEKRLDVIDRLLELGASVNKKSKTGETPLHLACRRPGNFPLVLSLLRNTNAFTDPVINDTMRNYGSHEILLALLAYGFRNDIAITSRVRYRPGHPSHMVSSLCPFQVRPSCVY